MKLVKLATPLSSRLATMDDAFFIFALTKQCMAQHALTAWGEFNETEVRAECSTFVKAGAAQIICWQGRPIGVFTVRCFNQRYVIEQLYLLPDFQRRGIGREIMQAFLAGLSHGHEVELDVFNSNGARKFYQQLGFKIKSQYPDTTIYSLRP